MILETPNFIRPFRYRRIPYVYQRLIVYRAINAIGLSTQQMDKVDFLPGRSIEII